MRRVWCIYSPSCNKRVEIKPLPHHAQKTTKGKKHGSVTDGPRKSDAGRRRGVLDRQRVRKMSESAHAYVRGNTVQFYEWLASTQVHGRLPHGPSVWICGDCHTGNLGPIANKHDEIEIEVRDVDQTVIGNPAHDLLRLGLSLAMAARSSDLPGITTALMMEEMIGGYVARLQGHSANISAEDIAPVRHVMRQARARHWKHLAAERIAGVTPTIPLGKRYWALAGKERASVDALFAEPKTRELLMGLRGEGDVPMQVVDAAYWMKGCSSLGRLRYAVLVRTGGKHSGRHHLIDVKEATATAAPFDAAATMPADFAERVVCGARALSPFLGTRMLAGKCDGVSVVLRELRPQDMKFELDGLSQKQAVGVARLMAGVVGRAHGRQMAAADRTAWAATLKAHHSKGLDAPRWLWSGVLDLAALHEAAYLEHCRRYAMGEMVA